MCFAPQRRALSQHLNFQKWSGVGVFCTFWLRNVLRATTAYTFSTSRLPKVVRTWCVLYILTSKCASRHNAVHFFDISTSKSAPAVRCFFHFFTCKRASRHSGVQFFISHLASWLRTRRFSEPTGPSGATNHWKNTVFRDFPTFSSDLIFFLLLFSSLTFSISTFHLSILSEVWHLNFLRSQSMMGICMNQPLGFWHCSIVFLVCFPASEWCQEELVLRSHVANANDSISDYQH